VIDASAFQLLLMVVTGWLARREREVVAYLIEENRVDGELPVVPQRRLEEPVYAVTQPGPNRYGRSALWSGTRIRAALNRPTYHEVQTSPQWASHTGHAAIGV
jgi:hypothetical protein